MDEFNDNEGKHKKHNEPHGGRKAEKKKAKNPHIQEMTAKQRNPKAFAFNSVQKAERQFRRTMDIRTKKEHIPHVDRTVLEPPPFIVAIVGPPKVGKTTLMRCLIKNFCRQNLSNIQGPVTIVSGKKRRLTLIECNNDVNCMIDLAKVCDLALLLVDASFGFEMETFEFLNICQVHGFPKIMGVLTHLDVFRNAKTLRRTKKQMKHRFWTEIYQGAKLFYLSGMVHDEYMKNEVHNLGRFISVMKFHPQLWRQNHSYILADRMEDLTNPDLIRKNPLADRTICLYGYTRGAPLKNHTKVHIPGCDDFPMKEVSFLPDPCPLPDKEKKRSLNEKERLIYAPMSGVGGIVYDKDAVYIELGGSHSHKQKAPNYEKELISTLIQSEHGLDSKMEASAFTLFSGAKPLTIEEMEINHSNENDFGDRRKVSFDDEDNKSVDSASDDDDGDEIENDEMSDKSDKEEIAESSDDEERGHLKWKENLASKASSNFEHRQRTNVNLSILVYGTAKSSWGENSRDSEEEDEIIGGIFRRANQLRSGGKSEFTYSNLNGEESSKSFSTTRNWNDEETQDLIKDCFVTGKWDSKNDAKTILDEDENMFGDFEDLETGEVQKGVNMDESSEEDDESEVKAPDGDNATKKTRAERIIEKKKKLKAMFDTEYDEKDGKSFYDDLKAEMSEQAQLNRSEFENLDDEKRVQLEGFRSGLYVRVEIENIPCEFVKHFDSTYPIILGSLLNGEDTLGYVQVRLKKHRWYKRILKTRDPLIFSLGWRRFQTIPIYSIEDHNGRNRMLKYTPQHLYCLASFWGPITPQGAGILALQSLTEKSNDFRIAATGVVLDLDKSTEIMKKLKLTGEPFKIYKKTAFIKGMFNSALEVTKFEGAALRTVSGLRGQIKKAIRAPPGSFRATFEDKILLSDIVFLRSWYGVDVPKFYAPVTSLLLPPEEKLKWQGMKTVGQIKREKEIHVTPNEDSLYTPIERKDKVFKELKVPRSLHQQLPFAEKKKYAIVDKAANIEKQRIAVIQEPHEREVTNMMKMIKTVHSAKMQKIKGDMILRAKTHKLELKKIDERKNNRQKAIKKRVFQALGKMKQNKD